MLFNAYKNELVAKLKDIYGSPLEVIYPSSRVSIAPITWEPGTKIYSPGGDGIPPSYNPLTTTLEAIPCNIDVCCRVTYEISDDGSISIISSIDTEECQGAIITQTTVELVTQDSLGNEVTYTGTVDESSPCATLCDITSHSFGSFNTNMSTQTANLKTNDYPLEFSANPTLAHDFVTFKTTKPIIKIEIYDFKGRKVIDEQKIENNTIDISSLKNGIHFIRVYFSETNLNTVKILKQQLQIGAQIALRFYYI